MVRHSSWPFTINLARISAASGYCVLRWINCAVSLIITHRTKRQAGRVCNEAYLTAQIREFKL